MIKEEAINLVKQVLPCLNIDKKIREAFETLIPELRESEDERIGKCISMALTDVEERLKDCLAYLKKQKEQKHPNGCFTCDEYKKGYEEGRRNGFTAGYNKAMKEVEQKPVVTHGETYRVDTLGTQQVIVGKMPQKPAEWSEEEKDKLNSIERLIVNANAHGNYLIGDKEAIELQHFIRCIVKPITNIAEWSEEDEDMLNSCISSIEEAKESRYAYKETDGDTSYDHEIAWLKSLSSNLKKKNEDVAKLCSNEWSEEDRLHYVNVLEALEYVKGCKSDYDKIEAIISDIDWLKSLRNRVGKESLQPHWKPSEEQMKALLKVVDKARELHYSSNSGYDEYDVLRLLYKQLKEL